MQTVENSIIEACILYHIVIRIHSALICGRIQVFDIMVECNH